MRARTVLLSYLPALRSWLAVLPNGIRIVGNGGGLAQLNRRRQYRGTIIGGGRVRLSV
jgi:hypothetical protein